MVQLHPYNISGITKLHDGDVVGFVIVAAIYPNHGSNKKVKNWWSAYRMPVEDAWFYKMDLVEIAGAGNVLPFEVASTLFPVLSQREDLQYWDNP